MTRPPIPEEAVERRWIISCPECEGHSLSPFQRDCLVCEGQGTLEVENASGVLYLSEEEKRALLHTLDWVKRIHYLHDSAESARQKLEESLEGR